MSTPEEMIALRALAKKWFPEFQERFKTESRVQRLIGWLLFWMRKDGKSTYMTSFVTVMGYTVYWPSRPFVETPKVWINLAHEMTHMRDSQRFGKFWFSLLYLFPQCLAPLALLSLGAFWNISMLWFLLALVFALPWPAPFRIWAELEGYTTSMVCEHLETGKVSAQTIEHLVRLFTGPSYYYMLPFKDLALATILDRVLKVTRGEVYEDSFYEEMLDALTEPTTLSVLRTVECSGSTHTPGTEEETDRTA